MDRFDIVQDGNQDIHGKAFPVQIKGGKGKQGKGKGKERGIIGG